MSLINAHFDWKKVLNKEHGTMFLSITIVAAILLWEDAAHFGFDAQKPLFLSLIIVWLISLVGYITARVLKKTGHLRAMEMPEA